MTPELRAAQRSDVPAISAVFARAFYDDPINVRVIPDPAQRITRSTRLFATLARQVHLPFGGCELALHDGRLAAAALWDPPGHHNPSARRGLLTIMGLTRALGPQASLMRAIVGEMDRLRPKESHWYLGIIGTEPELQGTGIGTALMRSGLQKCDADGQPAYLESSKNSNVPYYENFGFRVTQELPTPNGPTLWPMWRDAGGG